MTTKQEVAPQIPEVGQAVRVRNRLATVRAVEPYDSRTQGRLNIVEIEYLDDFRYPEAEQLLWEVESTAMVLGKTSLPRVDENRPDDRIAAKHPAVHADPLAAIEEFLGVLDWVLQQSKTMGMAERHDERRRTLLLPPAITEDLAGGRRGTIHRNVAMSDGTVRRDKSLPRSIRCADPSNHD
jgi:hypothetical protein